MGDPFVTVQDLVNLGIASTIIQQAVAQEVEKHTLIGGAMTRRLDHTEEVWNLYEQVARRKFEKRHKLVPIFELSARDLYSELGLNPKDHLSYRTVDEEYAIRQSDQRCCKKKQNGRLVPVLKNARLCLGAITAIFKKHFPNGARLSQVIDILGKDYHCNEKHGKLLFQQNGKLLYQLGSTTTASLKTKTTNITANKDDVDISDHQYKGEQLSSTDKVPSDDDLKFSKDPPTNGPAKTDNDLNCSADTQTDDILEYSATVVKNGVQSEQSSRTIPTKARLQIEDGTGRHADGLHAYDGGASTMVDEAGGSVVLHDNRALLLGSQARLKEAEARKKEAEVRGKETEERQTLLGLLGQTMADNKEKREAEAERWRRRAEELEREKQKLLQRQQQQQQQLPQQGITGALVQLASEVKKGRKQNVRHTRTIMQRLTPKGKAPPVLDSDSSPSTAGASPATTGASPSTADFDSPLVPPKAASSSTPLPSATDWESPLVPPQASSSTPKSSDDDEDVVTVYSEPTPTKVPAASKDKENEVNKKKTTSNPKSSDEDEEVATVYSKPSPAKVPVASKDKENSVNKKLEIHPPSKTASPSSPPLSPKSRRYWALTKLSNLYSQRNQRYLKLQKVVLEGSKVGTVVGVTESMLWCVLDSVSVDSMVTVLRDNQTDFDKKRAAKKTNVVLQKNIRFFEPLDDPQQP